MNAKIVTAKLLRHDQSGVVGDRATPRIKDDEIPLFL